jgi:hypothetical protein
MVLRWAIPTMVPLLLLLPAGCGDDDASGDAGDETGDGDADGDSNGDGDSDGDADGDSNGDGDGDSSGDGDGDSGDDGGDDGGGEFDCVVHVVGPGGNDTAGGITWATAKHTIQAAIDTAEANGCAVFVKAGTYRPAEDDDRDASFVLADDVELFGGFAGTELTLGQRDVEANQTILSGDIGVEADYLDNSRHVVIGADDARLDGFTVTQGYADDMVDNFDGGAGLYTGGAAADMVVANCRFVRNRTGAGLENGVGSIGGTGGYGAGIFQEGGDLSVIDTIFEDNRTGPGGSGTSIGGQGGPGAGLAGLGVANLVVRGCTFVGNRGGAGGSGGQLAGTGGSGAGLFVTVSSDATIVDSRFENNEAGPSGPGFGGFRGSYGGAYLGSLGSGRLVVANSVFRENEADFAAGAALTANNPLASSEILVFNTLFSENQADNSVGGLFVSGIGAQPITVSSCTFEGNNSGGFAGALQYAGGEKVGDAPVRVANSIFWNNDAVTAPEHIAAADHTTSDEVPLEVDFVDIEGGCDDQSPNTEMLICGDTILDVDPDFANAGAGNLQLQDGSPLRDQGDTDALPADVLDLDGDQDTAEALPLDLAGEARVSGEAVDLGAYELP